MRKLGLIAVAIIWASSFIFIKWGLLELKPFNLAFWRFLLASPLLFGYVYLRKRDKLLSFEKRDFLPLVVLGLTGVSLLYAVQFMALKFTTATNASILINSSVLFIAAFSILLLGERITTARAGGIVVGMVGISLVLSNGKLNFFSSTTLTGDLLMIFDGLLWAIYTIGGKSLLERHEADALTAWAFVAGIFTLLPFLTFEGLQIPIKMLSWASIIFLAVFCSFVGYLIWYKALEVEDASKVAIYIYMIPFFTAIMAFFLLNEKITVIKILGGVLTILGVYLAERG
ncbi:MAG: DMT family transporter [Archaeoglobus sp.]|nr:DMT family transporter [Archaeoglobus sp.]